MIEKDKLVELRTKAPLQAESVYLHAKECLEKLKSGEAVDVTKLRHLNFEDILCKKGIRKGQDCLSDDLVELITIWENEIAV